VSFSFDEIDAATKAGTGFHANQPEPTEALCSTKDMDVRGWIDTCDARHSCLRIASHPTSHRVSWIAQDRD